MDTRILVAALVFAAVVGMLLYARVIPAQQSVDGQVIAALRKAGSDLTKPHAIEFFLYFPSKDSADHVATQLSAQGFGSKVERSAEGPQWLLLATKSMVPAEQELTRLRRQFNSIAKAEHGEYDGWGCELVK